MTLHGLTILGTDLSPALPVPRVRLWDCGVTWRHLQPNPGRFDFGPLDRVIDAAHAAGGRDVLYVLGGTPAWAAKDPGLPHAAPWLGSGSNSLPKSTAAWEEYVEAVVTRYRDAIGSWEVWNEPQLVDFYGYTDYRPLARLTARAYAIIHRIDPFARVLSGAVLPRTSSGGMKRGGRYLDALGARDWPIDVHNAHLYPDTGTGIPGFRAAVRAWIKALEARDAPPLPRWITEANLDLLAGPIEPPDRQRAAVGSIDAVAAFHGIRRLYWYAWQHSDPMLAGIPLAPGTPGTRALERIQRRNG